jgi:hypothetical protein
VTVWGGFTNHLRIGLDVWTDGYDSYTPSINVYMTWYVQCDSSFNFNDSQTLVMTSPQSNSWTFQNTLGANGYVTFGWTIYGQGQSYGGGPTYHFGAQLNGVYLGAGPSFGWDWALPAKPIRVTTPPGTPSASGVTANHADFGWAFPGDVGGSNPDYTWLQIGTTNFGNLVYDNQQPGWNGRSLDIFAPGVTYYMRTAAHNGAGWSGWSGTGSFTANSFTAGTPALSNVAATTLTVSWTAPGVSPAPTGYQLQVATDSGFSNVVQTLTHGWATSVGLTGLIPGTTYYIRVRALSPNGYGAWSPAVSSKTLSGAKVRQAGAWKDAIAFVRVGGVWKQATVNKRVGGVWKL